jgi:hypothetical protein
MLNDPQNTFTDIIQKERAQKAMEDPAEKILPPKQASPVEPDPNESFFFEKHEKSGSENLTQSFKTVHKNTEMKRILGLKITSSDIKAKVEWKDPDLKTSWESIQDFSRVNHFLQEAGEFNVYFGKRVRRYQNKFINVPPRYKRFCRRSHTSPMLDFQFGFSGVNELEDPMPNLISFFSNTYFSVSSSHLLKRRISKKKKIFYYVRNPESVESSMKSELSSTHQDNSLLLKDHTLVADFIGNKSLKDDHSFESETMEHVKFGPMPFPQAEVKSSEARPSSSRMKSLETSKTFQQRDLLDDSKSNSEFSRNS